MAKFTLTIEDGENGDLAATWEGDFDEADYKKPTNACVLALLIDKLLKDELEDDYTEDGDHRGPMG